jgi:hypothetical protein
MKALNLAWAPPRGRPEMTRRLETKAAAARRARSEFDAYGDSILLNETEAAAVAGFSPNTLKSWRLSGSDKGPAPTYLNGMVRYRVGNIRRWRSARETAVNDSSHGPRPKTREIEPV